ncbi:MAG TPA: DUF58 domain-containing protein [Actinomycetota bacterium]|nr:DUF58 domain-containing protein [Actinomycetota bacterium]
MRLRRRAGGLLLGAAVLFLIGTNVQSGILFVLAALLLGALVAGLILPFAALRGLAATIDAPAQAEQGEASVVDLRLANGARGVRWSVLAVDEHLEPATVFLPAVRPGGDAEVTTLRIPATRGDAVTTWVEVRSAAPFGVAERRRRLPVDATTLVLPRRFPLGPLPFVEAAATHDIGIRSAPRLGHGPDFMGVREYRGGDAMRHVHWGLTARHGQIMVREFEEERTRRLAIVVDTERDEGEAWTPLDRACAVAASVLDAALAQGHGARVAAAVEGRTEVLSRERGDEMHRWLARLGPTGTRLVDALRALPTDALRGVGTLIVTFPVWQGTDLGAVADAVAGTVPRVVLVPVLGAEDPPCPPLDGVEIRPWREGEDLAVALAARGPS